MILPSTQEATSGPARYDTRIQEFKNSRIQEVRSTPRAGAREDLKRNWRSAHLAVFREVQESGVQEEKTCWYRRTMNAWAESTVKAQNSLRSGKCGARTMCRSSILQLLTPATPVF